MPHKITPIIKIRMSIIPNSPLRMSGCEDRIKWMGIEIRTGK